MPFSFEDNIYSGHLNVNAEKTSGVEPGHIDDANKNSFAFYQFFVDQNSNSSPSWAIAAG